MQIPPTTLNGCSQLQLAVVGFSPFLHFGFGVGVGVAVGVAVGVTVGVAVGVAVGVGVGVGVAVGDSHFPFVPTDIGAWQTQPVSEGFCPSVQIFGVGVGDGVTLGVAVGVGDAVGVTVGDTVGVGVGEIVGVGVGMLPALSPVIVL